MEGDAVREEDSVMAESWTETLNNGVGMRMLTERPSWKPLESQVMLGIYEDSQLQVTYRTLGCILALHCSHRNNTIVYGHSVLANRLLLKL